MRTLLFLAVALMLNAQAVDEAAARLAARILKAIPNTAIRLTFENRASIPKSVADRIRRILEKELRPSTKPNPMNVQITLSKNQSGYLLVAQANSEVLIEPLSATPEAVVEKRAELRKRTIITETSPILDFAITAAELVILTPAEIITYRRDDERWTQRRSFTIAEPPVRDLRGRLIVANNSVEAHLPGLTCAAALPVESISCKPEDTSWTQADLTMTWMPGRNYLVSPQVGVDFYSAAKISDRIIATTTDGGVTGWKLDRIGSEFALLRSACAATPVVLASSPTADEWLQAFDENRAFTGPLDIQGEVAALWPAESPEEASVVVRDSKSGQFEASRVSIACPR